MKTYRRPGGTNQFYFSDDEIETMMEDDLHKAGLYPDIHHPVTDLEALIERHLGAKLEQYADLEPSILGKTEFYPNEHPRVSINKNLTVIADDGTNAGLYGRWRATLAHEAVHVRIHRVLFEFDDMDGRQGLLFDLPKSNQPVQFRCMNRDFSGSGDPREVQANKGMAALLMPRRLFRSVVDAILEDLGLQNATLDQTQADVVARRISKEMQVSIQAASIRLRTLKIVKSPGDLGLPLGESWI